MSPIVHIVNIGSSETESLANVTVFKPNAALSFLTFSPNSINIGVIDIQTQDLGA